MTAHSKATWRDAARDLHKLDPEKYNTTRLGKIFGKSGGTVWWTVHQDLRREYDRDRNREPARKKMLLESCQRRRQAARERRSSTQLQNSRSDGAAQKDISASW